MTSPYVRRPRRGDRIRTRFGDAAVVAVRNNGRTLDVATSAHGTVTVTRADTGWWYRA